MAKWDFFQSLLKTGLFVDEMDFGKMVFGEPRRHVDIRPG